MLLKNNVNITNQLVMLQAWKKIKLPSRSANWVVAQPRNEKQPQSGAMPNSAAGRKVRSAYRFMRNLQPRLKERVQLTTDGHHAYLVAVKAAFLSTPMDYAMLVKIYDDSASGYSPAEVVGARKERILGLPDETQICTSHAERNNLTMRMQIRRFTRLTNAFSKKLENHIYMMAIYFMHYNFCRIHQTLRVTPAMEAGISDHVWSLEEIVNLIN